MGNRVVIWVGGVIGALLIATIIVGIILINTINGQSDDAAYRDCLARHGFASDARAPAVSDEDLDAYLNEAIAAADACTR